MCFQQVPRVRIIMITRNSSFSLLMIQTLEPLNQLPYLNQIQDFVFIVSSMQRFAHELIDSCLHVQHKLLCSWNHSICWNVLELRQSNRCRFFGQSKLTSLIFVKAVFPDSLQSLPLEGSLPSEESSFRFL